MRNKGSKILLFRKKKSNTLMPKMRLSWCSFSALLSPFILFPKHGKYWMPGIIPFNKWVCDFYHIHAVGSVLWTWRTIKWFSRQSEVTENDRSLTPLVADMTRRIFATMAWARKSTLLHLTIAQTPPVVSRCQSTSEPPVASSTSSLWSHL